MVLPGKNPSFNGRPKASGAGVLINNGVMEVLLVLVIFNSETGSEVETRMDLDDEAACHAAALETFQVIDEGVAMRPMEVPHGQETLDGTMIAYF